MPFQRRLAYHILISPQKSNNFMKIKPSNKENKTFNNLMRISKDSKKNLSNSISFRNIRNKKGLFTEHSVELKPMLNNI